jgi:diacylglycerol kinase (ATP)
MRKVLLLYNPLSGQRRRTAEIEAALNVFRGSGVEASATPTRAAGDASEQVKQAIADGCDTIFACGGDGTVHDVLQGLVGTDTVLGVIPLGTANSLAHDLRLPLSPVGAAQAALRSKPRRIAVGRVEYFDLSGQPAARCFVMIVGVGVDAHLFYKLNAAAKRRLGMAAYYVKATHLWLTHKMPHFSVEVAGEGLSHPVEVTQLLAVRIQEFGGVLRQLAPEATLERDDLRLVLFRTRSRLAYLGYIVRGLLGRRWKIPGIDLEHSTAVNCRPLAVESSRILIEADGELLGTLPARISVIPGAVSILAPER